MNDENKHIKDIKYEYHDIFDFEDWLPFGCLVVLTLLPFILDIILFPLEIIYLIWFKKGSDN